MSSLIRELLKDYGTVCTEIGLFLNKKNNSTLMEILKNVNIDKKLVCSGISILLQRRILSYFSYDRNIHYTLDKKILKKRVFFNMYIQYAYMNFNTCLHKSFIKILLSGISGVERYKEDLNDLTKSRIVKKISRKELYRNKEASREDHQISKKFSEGKGFYVIEFDILDKCIFNERMKKYLEKRYSTSMKEIYKSIVKCTIINEDNVLNNLESTKILIKDGISYINEKNNILEYFKYLINSGIIKRDFDNEGCYSRNIEHSLDILRLEELSKIIKKKEVRRLLFLFYDLKRIEDNALAGKSLLSNSFVKNSLFLLHKYGIVKLEYNKTNGKENTKHGSIWSFNTSEFSKYLSTIVENKLIDFFKSINTSWSQGNILKNEKFYLDVSNYYHLSQINFVLNLEVQ